MRGFSLLILSLLTIACSPQNQYPDYVRESWQTKCKPKLALVPIIDKSGCELPWDVADEITDRTLELLIDSKDVLITPIAQFEQGVNSLPANALTTNNLDFARKFSCVDFVVLMELVDQEFAAYCPSEVTCQYRIRGELCDEILKQSIRLRIIDVRGDCPRLIAQEIFESNQMIPRAYSGTNYALVPCGSQEYHSTWLACSHQRLARDLSARIVALTMCQR